ncbi:MAG: TrmH family RNA methyltransferase [Clostridiales bacterium]|nr:TrmH family RNA methyltransferase [Clostridiales bacterium]MDO4349609.1 TrmH family RNA methyltransferase [Eubacteriales bacterium]MDY4009289.1 TrmH family RNA methyltransferase [Candidatus Limiplasma sp.]
MPPLKPYSADLPYSYAPGVFPSMALMQNAPERALRLLLSERAQGEGVEKLRALCREHHVREETADKALSRISGKQNCYAAVVFEKWQSGLAPDGPHVVLHHPMDEGNLGSIQRTLLGLGIPDIAVIRPAADVFDPKVVRATMGAVFSLRVKQYEDFASYRAEHPGHALYPFMLDGAALLEEACQSVQTPYALVFGNEGSGLPPEFARLGRAVRIPHNDQIDSLNLSVAVGIGAYAFVHAAGRG